MKPDRHFMDLWRAREAEGRIACVGLDPDPFKLPENMKRKEPSNGLVQGLLAQFLQDIVDATHDIAGTYKANSAFFLMFPEVLRDLVRYIHARAPHVPVIVDGKWADIGNTNEQIAGFAYDYLEADAVTVHAWHGHEAMEPFLQRAHKGVFVVCRTSNPGSAEFQRELTCESEYLFQYVASQVRRYYWNDKNNCGLVVGGTCTSEDITAVRVSAGEDMPLLMPGFGRQGGDLNAALAAGINSTGGGVLPVSARAIIHASSGENYARAARDALITFNNQIRAAMAAMQEEAPR